MKGKLHNVLFREVKNFDDLKGMLKPMNEFSATQNNIVESTSVGRGNKSKID